MPRYWRYLVAALVGLGAGAVFRGTIGVMIGVFVALTIILMIESRTQRARRRYGRLRERSGMFPELTMELVSVGIAAELPAVQASKEVCARRSVAIERGEELVPGGAFAEPGRVADRLNRVRRPRSFLSTRRSSLWPGDQGGSETVGARWPQSFIPHVLGLLSARLHECALARASVAGERGQVALFLAERHTRVQIAARLSKEGVPVRVRKRASREVPAKTSCAVAYLDSRSGHEGNAKGTFFRDGDLDPRLQDGRLPDRHEPLGATTTCRSCPRARQPRARGAVRAGRRSRA
jgi:hypothetical protein